MDDGWPSSAWRIISWTSWYSQGLCRRRSSKGGYSWGTWKNCTLLIDINIVYTCFFSVSICHLGCLIIHFEYHGAKLQANVPFVDAIYHHVDAPSGELSLSSSKPHYALHTRCFFGRVVLKSQGKMPFGDLMFQWRHLEKHKAAGLATRVMLSKSVSQSVSYNISLIRNVALTRRRPGEADRGHLWKMNYLICLLRLGKSQTAVQIASRHLRILYQQSKAQTSPAIITST